MTRAMIAMVLAAMLATTAKADRLQRIYEATCRVSVSGGTGTGTVFREDGNHYYILTNAHVVGASKTAGVEFIKDHWPSPRLRAAVTGRKLIQNGSFDVAVLRLAKSQLNGVELPVIPLATGQDAPAEVRLITCGCQAGEMPSLQQVLTIKNSGQLIYYVPPAKPGRSGSALIDIEGEKIYGLVAWETRNGTKSNGLAMTTERILPWLVNRKHAVEVSALPPGTTAIPLAPDVDAAERIEAAAQSQCDPDSPWCPNRPQAPSGPGTIGGADNPWADGGGRGRKPPAKPDDVSRRMKVLLDAQSAAQSQQLADIAAAVDGSVAGVADQLRESADSVASELQQATAATSAELVELKELAGQIHVHINKVEESQQSVGGVVGAVVDIFNRLKGWFAAGLALIVADRLLSRVWSPQWPSKTFGPLLQRVLSIKAESKSALRARLKELEEQVASESE